MFLIKLYKEGKLQIVEPSNILCESYLKKSDSHFHSAKILLESKKLEESASMAYYGMYHSLIALMFRCGIKSENHSASIFLLESLFKEELLAKEITFGKKERIDKQYYTDFKINERDCKDMITKAEHFILQIKNIIKNINQHEIIELKSDLNRILNFYNKKRPKQFFL